MTPTTSNFDFQVSRWSDREIQQTPEFTDTVRETNIRGLIIAAGVTWFGLLLFWIPDHYVMPELVTEALVVRLPVVLFSLFIFITAAWSIDWLRENSYSLGIALFTAIGATITPLCWMAGGLESQYYASLNLVFIGIVLFFNFSRMTCYSLLWGIYFFYISPIFLENSFFGLDMAMTDTVQVFNNQFFLLSTLAFCTVGYHFRYKLIIEGVRYTLQQREINEELTHLANHDSLTGLPNRRSWFKNTTNGHEEGESREDSSGRIQHWLAMMDLDHFKRVNDEFGHQAGDRVLEEVAEIIKETIRSDDRVARYGGEEFIVELKDTNEVEVVAERLRSLIDNHTFQYKNETIQVTTSIGVAPWKHDQSKEDVISRADRELYRAKSGGRNQLKIAKIPSRKK